MGLPQVLNLTPPRLSSPIFLTLLIISLLSILTYTRYPTIQNTICRCQSQNSQPASFTSLKTFFPAEPPSQDRNQNQDQDLLSQAHLTANGGFFMIKPNKSSKPQGYGVSMLHQSHCVDMLRAALFGGEHDHMGHFRGKHKRDGLRDVDSLDAEHLEHCLDYISQGIVCCADDTLEPRLVDPEKKVAVINGKGVKHRCRDARGVLEAVGRSQVEPVVVEEGREIVFGEGDMVRDVLRY